MYASMRGNLDVVQHLIEIANADPNKQCKDGKTALMYSLSNPTSPVVLYLMECEKVNLSIKSLVSND